MAYTLDQIVREYIIENGGAQLNTYARCYTIAVSGLRELATDVSAVPKSVELPINPNDTVDLPLGFLNYISVNFVGTDGRLWGLGKNNSIDLTRYYNDCGVPVRHKPHQQTNNTNNLLGVQTAILANPTYLAAHYRNGENYGAYFNAGGHNMVGYYKFDYNNNQIVLSGLNCHKTGNPHFVVLEYISDLESQDDDYIIHPFIVEALKAFIYWKYIQRDRNQSLGEKQMAEEAYRKTRKTAVRRFNMSTAQELLDAYRSAASGIPRW